MTAIEIPGGVERPVSALPESAVAWRAVVREFAETEVQPLVQGMDEAAALDPDLAKKLVAAGLMGIEIPRTYGGAGGDLLAVILAIEELARVDPAVAVYVDVQNALVASALLRHGTGDQRRRYLPRLATGLVGAYALSEEQAGSDAFAMSTRAEPDGDGFVLNGAKDWTTNAAEAGLFVVFARAEGAAGGASGLTAFLIERDAPGLSVGPPFGKMGIRASSTRRVELDGVRVGRENVLDRVGGGEQLAIETLNIGKLGVSAQLVGLAQGALDTALRHARQRTQFRKKIITFQGVLFPLARIATELEAARVLLYDAVRVIHHGTAIDRMKAAAMVKYLASEVAEQAASQAVETLGGNGFTTAYPAEKFYRDAKIGKIYEGTSNIQLRTIGAALLRESR